MSHHLNQRPSDKLALVVAIRGLVLAPNGEGSRECVVGAPGAEHDDAVVVAVASTGPAVVHEDDVQEPCAVEVHGGPPHGLKPRAHATIRTSASSTNAPTNASATLLSRCTFMFRPGRSSQPIVTIGEWRVWFPLLE